jgi:excisionase family DNA binding protein
MSNNSANELGVGRKAKRAAGCLESTKLLTPEECAAFLQIEVATLYVMKHQRRIPYRKVGHLLRFDLGEIIEWTKPKSE